MSPQLVAILAAIFAEQTRVVAMSCMNNARMAEGEAPVYVTADFDAVIGELTNLSIAARNCQ